MAASFHSERLVYLRGNFCSSWYIYAILGHSNAEILLFEECWSFTRKVTLKLLNIKFIALDCKLKFKFANKLRKGEKQYCNFILWIVTIQFMMIFYLDSEHNLVFLSENISSLKAQVLHWLSLLWVRSVDQMSSWVHSPW